jgi:hypothetical protein
MKLLGSACVLVLAVISSSCSQASFDQITAVGKKAIEDTSALAAGEVLRLAVEREAPKQGLDPRSVSLIQTTASKTPGLSVVVNDADFDGLVDGGKFQIVILSTTGCVTLTSPAGPGQTLLGAC